MELKLSAHVDATELLAGNERVAVKFWFDDKPNENLYFLAHLTIDQAREWHAGQAVTIEVRSLQDSAEPK